ncbi:MAG: cation diffusion facilitator family transporter [Acidimicrobiia bacterium]|nr:cation diffusion facilitator family transporter [Acidimicrobiia bacterium]
MATEGSKTAVLAAIIGNSAIAVAKFAAAAVTGSSAMFSEGVHSVADTGNQTMLLWGLNAAKKEANADHPFGRGKEIYFWSFMVAVILFVGGAILSIDHGIEAIRDPHELDSPLTSVIVLLIAIVIEGFTFAVALREFNRVRGTRSTWRSIRDTKDTALLVVLLEDSAAMAGLLLALIGIGLAELTGNPIWDGVASVAIGLLLAVIAFVLAFETKALLVGEAASRRDRASIRSLVLAHPNVTAVGRLLTMHMGPSEILVNLDVDLVSDLDDQAVEQAIDEIEAAIREVLPSARNIFVELESIRG